MRLLVLFTAFILSPLTCAEPLLVATPQATPPFVMTNKKLHHFYGYSIDMMNAICQRIGATCRYQEFTFKDMFSQIMDGNADIAAGNITITSERQQFVEFSLPYLRSEVQFVTLSRSDFASSDDLQGKTIGVEAASIFPDYINQKYNNHIKIISYATIADLFLALNNNEVDAVMVDRQTAEYWYANNGDLFKLLQPVAQLGMGIAFMTNKINQSLISRINKALLEMESDGTYLKIFNTYFGDMTLKV